MKGILWQTSILSVLMTSYTGNAFADDEALPSPPPLSAYMAYQTPKPPIHERVKDSFWFLRGWYATGYGTYSHMSINDITNLTQVLGTSIPVVRTAISENKTNPGVAIGYHFRKSGILSRVEIAYLPRFGMTYNASPYLNFGTPTIPNPTPNALTSKMTSQVLFAKVYDDFNFEIPVMPYIQAGAGATINTTSGNASVNLVPEVPGFTINGTNSDGPTSFAWEVGAGTRVKLSQNFYLDFSYEFESLGKFTWDVKFPPQLGLGSAETKLQSSNVYSNTLLAGLSWEPIPREIDSNNLVDNFNSLSSSNASNNNSADNNDTISY